MGMPRHLSSCRINCNDWNAEYKWAMSPPKDYSKYKDLIYRVIKFLSVDNGLGAVYYEGWAEPDHMGYWRGSQKEYLEIYKAFAGAALHIRKRFQIDIKIGAPGTVSWNGYRGGSLIAPQFMEAETGALHQTIVYELISYCKEKRLPLDFVSFHRYDNDSTYNTVHQVGQRIRKWLRDFDLDPDIPLIVTEWNLHLDNAERNNEKGASFIPAAIYDMDRAGLTYHTFFSLQDFGDMDPAPGGLGLFTLYGVAKPSYNAFLMLSKLGDRRLKVWVSEDPTIGSVATLRRDEKIAILIWNYAQLDPAKVLKRTLLGQEASGPYLRGLPEKEQTALLARLKEMAKKGQYLKQINTLSMNQSAKMDIITAMSDYSSNLAAQKQAKKISVRIRNVDPEKGFKYSRWLIDADHSNGFKDNLEFIFSIKMRVLQDTLATFREEGMTPNDIKILATLLTNYLSGLYELKPEKTAAAKKDIGLLPKGLKKQFERVTERYRANLQQAQSDLVNKLYEKTESINERPSVKLQQVEQKLFPAHAPLEWDMVLQPYSVTLIIMEKI
jgi:beta-xylosidase